MGNHWLPVTCGLLTEEACCGVPRAVVAVEQPAPAWDAREQKPDGLAECSGEVSYGCVDGKDEIERGNGGCSVGEVALLCEGGGEREERCFGLAGGGASLERVEGDALHSEERGERGQRKRAHAIAAIRRIACPDEADAEGFG